MAVSAVSLTTPALRAAAVVNGTIAGGEYATTLATQNTPTGFGDNFSELNQAFANYTPGGNLELALTGNLETIGNRLILFIDSKVGGGIANSVAGGFNQFGSIPGTGSDDWGTDINASANVTPSPGGASVLVPGFNPDYALEITTTGGASYFVNVVDLTLPNTPSNNANIFIGSGSLNSGNAVTHTYLRDGGVTDSGDITSSFNNTNTAGVTDVSAANAATATKGLELIFESQFLGVTPGHALRILPFITSSDGKTLSNQFLPGLNGAGNPGVANNPLGTPLFDARNFSDKHYLSVFVPTLQGVNWYSDPWTGGVAPNGVEQAARVVAPPAVVSFGATGATLGYLEIGAAAIGGGGNLNFNGGNGAAILLTSGFNNVNATVNVQTDLRINTAGPGSVSFAGLSAAAGKRITKVGAGSWTVGGTVSNGANVDVLIEAGAFTANADLGTGLVSATTAPDVVSGIAAGTSPATVTFGSTQTLHSLIVYNNATASMLANGARALIADDVSLEGTAKFDLSNNNAVLTGMSPGVETAGVYGGVQGLVQQAYAGGTWSQPGITTSQSDALTGLTGLGVATGEQVRGLAPTDTGIWNGVTITGSDTLVMYTYVGDANLDGFISGDDYSAIDFAIAVPGADGWVNGDFNWDGIISGDDYSAIDFNIVAQGAPLNDSAPAGSVVAVPEPAACLIAGAFAVAAFVRRRRRVS